MMASGCLVLPHSRGGLKRSFWRCNFAQPMQPGRSEGSSTLPTQRGMCPDPELLSHLGTAPCVHAPTHTKPQKASSSLQPANNCFRRSPRFLRIPPGSSCSGESADVPQLPANIKSTWDLELLVASQHHLQGLFARMNHSGLQQAN